MAVCEGLKEIVEGSMGERTSNTKEDSMTTFTGKCTHQCGCPYILLPKQNTQNWHPPKSIVSSRGSITYEVAKELANIICLLIGQCPHHLKNTHHFIQDIKEVKLEPGEVMTSYHVKALFTSVPMDPSINIVKQKVQQEPLNS